MKKLVMVAALLLLASNAFAEVLCEGFDDPLAGWRDRWLAQNSDMRNYYVCTGDPNENNRGNNPCGLWICDGDADAMNASVEFNAGFGATVSHFAIGIMAFVPCDVYGYDLGGNEDYHSVVVVDGTFPPCPTRVYEWDTPNGLGRLLIAQTAGSQVEGNTSVDNVCATIDGPVPVVPTSWGQIKSAYR